MEGGDLSPEDMAAEELYRMLDENPDQAEFTQADMEEYHEQ